MAEWKFIISDLQGVVQGEVLNAKNRRVSFQLNSTPTATFNIRLDNPLASYIMGGDCLLKCYRDGVLVFHGPLVSAEEVGDDLTTSVTANFAGAFYRLQRRFTNYGTVTASNRLLIVDDMLEAVNHN